MGVCVLERKLTGDAMMGKNWRLNQVKDSVEPIVSFCVAASTDTGYELKVLSRGIHK
jgi:hypothetical protein